MTLICVTVPPLDASRLSLPVRLTEILVSSLPLAGVGVATGGSLTGLTVIAAVAAGEVAPPLSVTVNGMLTVPLKLAAGTNIMLAACRGVRLVLTGTATGGVPALPSLSYNNTPWLLGGKVATRIKAIVPSASVPVRLSAILPPSSLPLAVLGVATGARLFETGAGLLVVT